MATVRLTPDLRDEYQRLFDTCMIRDDKAREVESLVGRIEQRSDRYATVGDPLGVPWYFVGVIHSLEASLNFNTHLHNGDPLTGRTVHVPAGRPKEGKPPFTWEVGATDALEFENLHQWHDWSLPGTLYKLEAHNGFGYRTRHPECLSPYLWSYSDQYIQGKYVADGRWSPAAVSRQCGGAVLLRRMAETGTLKFDAAGTPIVAAAGEDKEHVEDIEPLVRYSTRKKSALAEELQRALNQYPGIFVKVDGIPGQRTSDALRKVTGHYLVGDPRA